MSDPAGLWADTSNGLVLVAIATYLVAMVCYAAESAVRISQPMTNRRSISIGAVEGATVEEPVVRTPQRLRTMGTVATALVGVGLGVNVAGVVARGIAAERVPWGNMYEFAIVAPAAAIAAFLTCLRRQQVRELGVWLVALAVLTLGLAVTVLYTEADALVPVLNSYWLVVHVAAAISAGGIFTLGIVATLLFVVRARADRADARGGESSATSASPTSSSATSRLWSRYAQTLPSASVLERVGHFAHMFAFPIWTFAVIAGAIWAENSWGRYWGWDPKETWAFITWVCYAAYLHAQATPAWKGLKASWFAVAGYAAFLFNFFGVNIWLPGLHSYAGV